MTICHGMNRARGDLLRMKYMQLSAWDDNSSLTVESPVLLTFSSQLCPEQLRLLIRDFRLSELH